MTVLAHRLEGPAGAPVVLLLNGGMMSMGAWEEIARELVKGYRVLRCDLRGQLLSPGEVPSDMRGHADDVAALLGELSLEKVHVLGTSFGGTVAVLLAARHPERVASLVVVTAVDRFDEAMLDETDRFRALTGRVAAGEEPSTAVYDVISQSAFSERYRTENAALIAQRRHLVSLLPKAWYQALEQLLASLHTADVRPELPRVTCPSLVVAADEDRTMPLAGSRALAEGLRARFEIVPGSGHALIVEQPVVLVDLVRSFLGGAEGSAAA